MRIVEYRIPLPMSVEEYQICQRFNVAQSSLEQTVKGPDGVRCLILEPFHDPNGCPTSFFTHKKISIANKVPAWIQSLVKKEWLTADEKSWNSYPKLKTTYISSFIPNLQFTIVSMHYPGVSTKENALNLSPEELNNRSIVNIDIINDPISSKDYNEEDDPLLSTAVKERYQGLGVNWMTTCPAKMTCYKVLILNVPIGWGVSSKIEGWMEKTLHNMFFLHHRRALASIGQWAPLTLKSLHLFECYVKEELDKIWVAKEKGIPQPYVDAKAFLKTLLDREIKESNEKCMNTTELSQVLKSSNDSRSYDIDCKQASSLDNHCVYAG